MSFLHPLYMWAAAAAVVPVILHLLLRRRAQNVQFPSLALLRLLQRRTARRMRLAQLLLMVVRVALVLFIALLFAQPVFRSGPLAFLTAGADRVVVLVDTSRSMSLLADDGTTSFQRALTKLDEVVGGLDGRSDVVVAAMSPQARIVFRGEPMSFCGSSLDGPAPVSPDIGGAAEMVIGLLENTPVARRRLVILSDFQRSTWDDDGFELLQSAAGVVPLLLHVGPESFHAWSLAAVQVSRREAVVGEPVNVDIEAVWSSRGRPPRGGRVVARVDGDVRASAPLPVSDEALGTGVVTVRMPVTFTKPGEAELVISVDDERLPMGARTSCAMQIVERRRVVLLNGNPRPAPVNDACFFLRRAVEAADPRVEIREVRESLLPTEPLLQGAVVVHAVGWTPLTDDDGRRLKNYVRQGGTLVVWEGDELDPRVISERILGPLMGIRADGIATSPSRWYARRGGETVLDHLVAPDYVTNVVSHQYRFIRSGADDGVQPPVALRTEDGTPILVVVPVDSGTAIYLNTSADGSWADFPLHPVYAVLVASFPRLTSIGARQYVPGERFVKSFPGLGEQDVSPAVVRSPSGVVDVVPLVYQGSAHEFRFEGSYEPGVHHVDMDDRLGRDSWRFEVLLDRDEAPLDFRDEREVEARSMDGGLDGASPLSVRLSDLLAAFVALLFLIEGVLVRLIERVVTSAETPVRVH